MVVSFSSNLCANYPTELKAGFSNDVNIMLNENDTESICVTVEGSTERFIGYILVYGEFCM